MNKLEVVVEDSFEQLAAFHRLLAHPVRLHILFILQEKPATVCHLQAITNRRQAYLSQQLGVLREGGLVECWRDGWNMYYGLSKLEIIDTLQSTRQLLGIEIDQATLQLRENSPNCSCPECQPEEYDLKIKP